jgi:hypothetical protein
VAPAGELPDGAAGEVARTVEVVYTRALRVSFIDRTGSVGATTQVTAPGAGWRSCDAVADISARPSSLVVI